MDNRVELILYLTKKGFEIDEAYGEKDERWRLNLFNKNYNPSSYSSSLYDWSVFIYKDTNQVTIWKPKGFYITGNEFSGKVKNIPQLEVILETLEI